MIKTMLMMAAVPLSWTVTPERPAPAQFDRYHGETLEFRCAFAGFGTLPFAEGADVRLWYQTNGMGAAWWSIPATVLSNVLEAAWGPSCDPGAERVAFFFGAPSNAYAAAHVRFRNSPGATPNDLQPPSVLDWQAELAAATNDLLNRIAELAPRTSLEPATNYTDALKDDLVAGGIMVYSAFEAQEVTLAQNANYAGYADTSTKTLALDDGNGGIRDTISVLHKLDEAANKSELSAVSSRVEAASQSVGTMWATLYGENVWIAITNYMRQVANTVPSLRLWEVRDSQTNMVYSSAEEIEHVVTQKVNAAKSEIKGMIPRRAWGSYQSSGEENPSSSAVTVVNSQKIMLTGGGEWYRTVETGGREIWILKTSGMMTLGGDTNGYFKVCDAEGNAQIEVVKTADQPVSAVPSATTFVDGDFTVTFNVGGSTHPTASCALDLGDDFEMEDGSGNINSLGISISWAKNSDNLWVATVHQDNPSDKLFIYAKALLQGENLVRNNAPTSLDGGIYINNVKYRLVPYSTGGKTYMTLEVWQ